MSLAGNERDHNHVAVYVLCRIQLVPPAISLNTNRPEVMVKARRIIHDLPEFITRIPSTLQQRRYSRLLADYNAENRLTALKKVRLLYK